LKNTSPRSHGLPAADESLPREALVDVVGGEIVRFQDATSAFDDAAAAVLALDRSDLPILTALLFQGPLAIEHFAAALARLPRSVHAALGRLQLAGYARRVPGAEDHQKERFELTQLAREWIETIWGPLPREGARLLQAWSPRELSLLAHFLALGCEVQERHGARIRALLEVPSTRVRNRLRGGLSPAALRRVQLFVEANLASPLKLADLAERARLSQHHFAHAFRASTGTTWHRGPMVIIGDAAHATSPSSGQGASLAIEDAVVLAKCLRDLPGPEQAFVTFERLRRRRVERVVQYSARIGKSKAAGAVARWFRDLFMPLALKHFANPAAHAWLYAYHVDWNERTSVAA
jgi:AraC family transcriptional regulator